MRQLRSFVLRIGTSLLLLCTLLTLAAGQATVAGRVTGVVTDPSGAVISGATVILRNEATNASRQTVTGSDGVYNFPLVAPGKYEVQCEISGFRAQIRPNIVVETQRSPEVDFTMQVGLVTENMVVNARAEMIETAEPAIGEIVDNHQIETLPNSTRYFAHFAELQPGVVQEETPEARFGGTGVGGFINGMRLDSNTVTLDGANMDDPTFPGDGSGDTVHFPLEGVQEMHIVLSSGSALLGSNTGGQMNVTSRSGSNVLHGSAYEYLRNDAFNAKDYFSTMKTPYKQHIFGFSLGGPIVKNKHFIFGTYERYEHHVADTFKNFRPTPLLLSFVPGGPAFGNLREALDAAFPPADPGFDPTLPVAEYTITLPDILSDHIFLVRTDHQLTSKDKLFTRAFYVHSFIDASGFNKTLPTDTSGFLLTPQNASLTVGYTHIRSPKQVNEFRASIYRLRNDLFGKPTPAGLVNLGFNPDSTGPGGFPFFIAAGTSLPVLGQLPPFPTFRLETVYQFSDTYSIEHGSHSLVMGADFYRALANATMYSGLRPTTIFVGYGPPFDNLGLPGLTSGDFLVQQQNFFIDKPERGIRRADWALYFGDTWRVHPKITLNLGLRWDYFGRPGDVHPELVNNLYQADNAGNAIPNVPITDITRVVLHQVGGNGGFAMYRRDMNDWGPRLGIAYRAFKNTVFRGGFSIFYGKPYFEQFNGNRFNPPFVVSTNIFFAPFGSTANPATDGTAPNIVAISPGWTTPRSQSYNFAIEQGLTPNTLLSLAYVGSSGHHLSIIRDPNLGDAPPGPRPNPGFSVIDLLDSAGISNYNSLQVQVSRRLASGLSFQANYTFAKSLDERSVAYTDFGRQEVVPSDNANLRADYGRSDFDITHQFKVNFYYDLPFGRSKRWGSSWTGVTNQVLGNWAISGVGSVRSGFPFSIYSGQDLNGDGIVQDRAPIIGNPQSIIINQGTQYLDPSAIGTKIVDDPTLPPSGRNIFSGPGANSWDLAIQKKFSMTERVVLDFRSEVLNFLNHPSFQTMTLEDGNAIAVPGGSFGKILRTASNSRVIQFSARLSF